MSSTTTIRRELGVCGPGRVYHRCGERMLHLSTYLDRSAAWCSDWWCNRCAVAEVVGGDDVDPVPLEGRS